MMSRTTFSKSQALVVKVARFHDNKRASPRQLKNKRRKVHLKIL